MNASETDHPVTKRVLSYRTPRVDPPPRISRLVIIGAIAAVAACPIVAGPLIALISGVIRINAWWLLLIPCSAIAVNGAAVWQVERSPHRSGGEILSLACLALSVFWMVTFFCLLGYQYPAD